MSFTKTLLARARFVHDGPRDEKTSASLAHTLAAVLAFDIHPERRRRLERMRSLVDTPARFEDPSAVVRNACSLVMDDAERKSVPLVVRCACESVRVRKTFSEALAWLLDNAIRANVAGRPVVVDVRGTDDHETLWEISDTGSGIPPRVLAHLGDPWTPSAEDGLGIAFANAIIQEHDGTLRFESREGLGTTASVLVARSELR